MNKEMGQKAVNRAVGSVEIVSTVLMVTRTDKDRPNERILVQVKSNLSPTSTAIVFSLSENGIEWIEETSKTADEV